MLNQYKNKDTFNQNGPDSANRFDFRTDQLLIKHLNITHINSKTSELHIYSNDTWLSCNYNIALHDVLPALSTVDPKKFNGNKVIAVDIFKEFKNLNITAGKFRFILNFFENIIGSYNEPSLYIDEVSPDRTEIRLKLNINANPATKLQFVEFTKYLKDNILTANKVFTQYLLNFSSNKTFAAANLVIHGESLYVKLLDQLPLDFDINFKCWLVREFKDPYTDLISITPVVNVNTTTIELSSPNWDASSDTFNVSSGTDVKNWNDLLGSSISVSQQIVDKYFSGSLSGVALNIDYRDFNNFIFYSSAEQRVRNFKYKLEMLEYYSNQITTLNGISGSTATTNIQDYETSKTEIISGLDSFETYLYYESSSLLYSNNIPVNDPTVASLTGSYIWPAPKSNTSKPYNLYPTTSSLFIDWYNALLENAIYYDLNNLNKLTNTLPDHIKLDESNTNVLLFVNMLGHHYDIIYTYIREISNIYKSEENPKLGIPSDLLQSLAKQFGWELAEGNQYNELWQYALGTDEQGIPLTGSNSVNLESNPGQHMTHHVWRRIVNNLPYILKSKGTKRSIQALLSCYGIPASFVTIKEYGGPRIERKPLYEKLNFDYSLDLINNTTGTFTVNYNLPFNGIEFRFKTDNVISNPLLPNTMNLVTIGSNTITTEFVSGTYGKLKINGTGSNSIELFDGNWITVLLQKNGTNLDLIAKKSKYGKIIATATSSASSSFNNTGNIIFGGTVSGSRLQGNLQEFRIWSSSISTNALENHTKAPGAYNNTSQIYNELLYRIPLTQQINHTLTSSLFGVQPKYVNNNYYTSSFTTWTNDIPYSSIEEIYYYDSPSIAMGTYDDNKVRLESGSINNNELYLIKRSEISEYDEAILDSNKLGVYFSPQTIIDEDIIAQLGDTELDSLIGDPGDTDRFEYPLLKQTSQNYWRKYSDRNDYNAYIKMFTLFDLSFFKQLEQLLPARVDKLTGLLIQPNLLERNKTNLLPNVNKEYTDYYFEITSSTSNMTSGDILYHTASISKDSVYTFTAEYNDIYNFYLTASNSSKYDGVKYIHDYLIKSGSTYITSSTPWYETEGVISLISSSVLSEMLMKKETFISGSVLYTISSSSTVTDFKPMSWLNLTYNGCKITSPGFNVSSKDTYQGKPVVEITITNPQQITFNTTTTTTPPTTTAINTNSTSNYPDITSNSI